MEERNSISPYDRSRIRVATGCDDSTIRKYPAVSAVSRRRIEAAAQELNIVLPGPRPQGGAAALSTAPRAGDR